MVSHGSSFGFVKLVGRRYARSKELIEVNPWIRTGVGQEATDHGSAGENGGQ